MYFLFIIFHSHSLFRLEFSTPTPRQKCNFGTLPADDSTPPPHSKIRGDAPAALPVLIFDLLHEKRISKFQLYTYYDLVKRRFNPISGRGVVFIHPSDFS